MQKNNKEKIFLLMILPALLGFFVFYILPTVLSFGYSFTNWSIYRRNYSFVGFENFIDLFKDKKSMSAVGHVLKYAVLITIFQNVFSIIFAVFLNKKLKVANTVKTLLFLPAVLSIMVVSYLFQYMLTSADSGLVNHMLQSIGLKPVNWLGDSKLALYSILICQVWQWTGWSMVIYIANLKSIDSTIFEASEIDGVTPLQQFFRVTLPLLYPAASFNILMCFIGGLKLYDAVVALTKGGPGYATETIMTTMIREGFSSGRNAYACTIAVVFFVVVTIMTRIITHFLDKWENAIS